MDGSCLFGGSVWLFVGILVSGLMGCGGCCGVGLCVSCWFG